MADPLPGWASWICTGLGLVLGLLWNVAGFVLGVIITAQLSSSPPDWLRQLADPGLLPGVCGILAVGIVIEILTHSDVTPAPSPLSAPCRRCTRRTRERPYRPRRRWPGTVPLFALTLLTGCGGVAGAEALVADTPPAPDPFWVCPIGEGDCGAVLPPLQLSPDTGPSAPAKPTSPNPAADEPPPPPMDAGVSVLPDEVARG